MFVIPDRLNEDEPEGILDSEDDIAAIEEDYYAEKEDFVIK